jgi:PhnB protein
MNEPKTQAALRPAGWRCLTPRIVTREPQGLVQFIKQVFGAEGELQTARPTVLSLGDCMLMISDAPIRDSVPAFLYLYVPNVDDTYQRAVKSGAESLEAPANLPYGDRRAMVKDRWGNLWQIATYLGEC